MTSAASIEAAQGAGCVIASTEIAGFRRVQCPDFSAKVRLLDDVATADARYDPRVRDLAIRLVDGLGSLEPARVGPVLHAAVRDRVRFVGEGIETFQAPIDTWERRAGDCDDFARLLLALARSLGMRAKLVTWEGDPKRGGHATVQLHDGIAWRWAEASIKAEWNEQPRAAYQRLHAVGATQAPRGELGELGGVGGLPHAEARATLLRVWPSWALGEPTPAAVQAMQAVALLESSYGRGWKKGSPMESSHNWGAVQTKAKPPCPAGTALQGDTHADGTPYTVCFKVYPDDDAGALDMLATVRRIWGPRRLAALSTGDADRFADAQIGSGYTEGRGKTLRDRKIAYRDGNFLPAIRSVAKSLGEPVMWTKSGTLENAAPAWVRPVVVGAVALGAGVWSWHLLRSIR